MAVTEVSAVTMTDGAIFDFSPDASNWTIMANTGSGNGYKFSATANRTKVYFYGAGTNATITFLAQETSAQTAQDVTVNDPTETVVASELWAYPITHNAINALRDSSGFITVETDTANVKIMVIDDPG